MLGVRIELIKRFVLLGKWTVRGTKVKFKKTLNIFKVCYEYKLEQIYSKCARSLSTISTFTKSPNIRNYVKIKIKPIYDICQKLHLNFKT